MILNNLAITCTMIPIGNRTSGGTKLRTEYRLNNLGVLEREPLRVRSAAADVANSAVITDEAVAPYTTLTRRDYCGNYVYCNGRLERVLTPGGYISGGEQHFYITDYQGNVRVVLDSAGRPVEVNSYYPYGALTGAGQSVQPYKYGAKELDRENGLNLYDSQARHYDPILGRTTTLDPKATEYFSISPYAWCAGNPVKFVDPDGRDATVVINGLNVTINVNIYIYGSGASQATAKMMEDNIKKYWCKNPENNQQWTYTDNELNKSFSINFNISVKLYDSEDPEKTPGLFSGVYNPFNRDNFIEIKDIQRSNVVGGDEGVWRSKGRGNRNLKDDDPSVHEFGHLLGFKDRYSKKGANKGWEGNIMAESVMKGKVEQRNIDALMRPIITQYKKQENKATFKTSINYNKMQY